MKSKNLILAEHLNAKVEVLNASLASTGVLHGHVTTEPIRQDRVSLSADLRAGFLSLVLVKSMPKPTYTHHTSPNTLILPIIWSRDSLLCHVDHSLWGGVASSSEVVSVTFHVDGLQPIGD